MPDFALPSSPENGIFPTTHWSLVRRAGAEQTGDVRAALTDLCHAYWYPLYSYVRRRGHGVHDAQDLTQSFVLELLDGELLSRADPDKGRFRSFVLGALGNFLANEHRRKGAARRGGSSPVFSLNEDRDESRLALESVDGLTPEEHFERSWALALLETVMRRVQEEYEAAGRGALFEALQPYLSGRGDQSGYADVGAALGVGENTVAVSIHRLRRRYGELLREEIACTVSSPAELDDELAHLLTILSR